MKTYHYNLGMYYEEVALGHGERPALRYHDRTVSHAELLASAVRLAGLLLARGCRRGDVIAIGQNKQPLSYALMLAALRLGVACVNIDVASPVVRNASILKLSGASLLFFDDPAYGTAMEELAAAHSCPLLFLSEELLQASPDHDRTEQQRLMRLVDGATIAYIMFTSGSTGVPKGVAVTHQNVLHFITWGQACFDITDRDNLANLSPMYFDNSVFDFYVGLFSGAALTPVHRDLLSNAYELIPYVGRMGCTIWFSVPSLLIYAVSMKAMNPAQTPALRTIVFGGEGYPKEELRKLFDLFSPRASLINVYGPTECTCICSAYLLGESDFQDMAGLPPLGRLNPNFDYRILDENDHDASLGELCLIGPNVASGYFNDLDRTAAVFHTITTNDRFMKRMYRTGDLVREEAGQLHFIGRKDNQIKHLGYRIELEEIEHALVKLPQVNQAAVVYTRTRAAYGKLVGFVSCAEPVDEKTLLVGLRRYVPDYMVPSRLIVLASLPKNPNGKVDRRRLQASLEDDAPPTR